MSVEEYTYLIIGLSAVVVIGSFYLVFKDGFKLEKFKLDGSMFKPESKEKWHRELAIEMLVLGAIIIFFIIFE